MSYDELFLKYNLNVVKMAMDSFNGAEITSSKVADKIEKYISSGEYATFNRAEKMEVERRKITRIGRVEL